MQLILHIGTPKTGTKALQGCLRKNAQRLSESGIYYGRFPGMRHSNALAQTVAEGKQAQVEAFLRGMVTNARTAGAETIVISAELLYGMTIFFHNLDGQQRNYWPSELASIGTLHSALPREIIKTKVVVFFRRQDRFLESFYQEVIQLKPVTVSIDEFKDRAIDLLDYQKNIALWRDVFGDCAIFKCDELSNSTEIFLREILHLDNTTQFDGVTVRRNRR